MKTIKRILKWVAILLLVIIAGAAISGTYLYHKKYDAPYPDIKVSSDSSVIAHGKHLANATAHCATCHFQRGAD